MKKIEELYNRFFINRISAFVEEALKITSSLEDLIEIAIKQYRKYGNCERLTITSEVIKASDLPYKEALERIAGEPEGECFIGAAIKRAGKERVELLKKFAQSKHVNTRVNVIWHMDNLTPYEIQELLKVFKDETHGDVLYALDDAPLG